MEIGPDTPAIVTGGASGLGAATARALAAAGAKVALLDLDEAGGTALAAELGGTFARCDVTEDASVAAALDAAQAAHGTARIVVTCAGIAFARRTVGRDRATGAPLAHDSAGFARTIAVNLVGTFRVLAQAAARMAPLPPTAGGSRGVAVLTASIAAMDGQIGQAAYAASKAGVCGLALPVARDLAEQAIRVNVIAPGVFATPMVNALPDDIRAALGASVPFPSRLGDPAEFAALALHCIRNEFLNGSVLRLDGALRMPPR
jgi:NAD(P)-dependent dehydrogenase (short-subunit alcohol dehydrogenase family)